MDNQTNNLIPYHTHNTIDSPNIDRSNLNFRIDTVAAAGTEPTDAPPNGTMRFLQDGVNYVMWVRINNSWKKATLS